jgi:catechol 2,3-dioxygenase-like lactoylglutathione lyase family enzyme
VRLCEAGGVLDQVTLASPDLPRSLRFYDAALGALDMVRLAELVDEEEDDSQVEAVGYGPPDAAVLLWLVAGTPGTHGVHIRFRAESRQAVKTFHERAVEAGGYPHSAPRRWPIYRRGEFNSMVRDPDGNLIEVVAPE